MAEKYFPTSYNRFPSDVITPEMRAYIEQYVAMAISREVDRMKREMMREFDEKLQFMNLRGWDTIIDPRASDLEALIMVRPCWWYNGRDDQDQDQDQA